MKKLCAALIRIFDRSGWREIATAPFDRELELAVIDGALHPIGVFCIRHGDGWLDLETLQPITITAKHWRFRWPLIFPFRCC